MAEFDDEEIASEQIKRLSAEYLIQKHMRDQAEEAMVRIKAQMFEAAGDRTQFPPTQVGDELVSYGVRSANRKPNAVALQRIGVPKEEFCSMTPSMEAFKKMVKARKWGDEYAARFIIDSGEKSPFISVRRVTTDEEE